MRLPLIEPVELIVKPINKALTPVNQRMREPVKAVTYGEPVTIDVQIYYTKIDRRNMEQEGNVPDSTGSYTTRQWILDDAGYEPRVGDKVISIAGRELPEPVYIEEYEPSAHLGGENTLMVMRFGSKSRTRKQ